MQASKGLWESGNFFIKRFFFNLSGCLGFQRDPLVAQMVKSLPAMQETRVQSLGWGRSPGEGNGTVLQYSCLENPMDRGAWWAAVHGVAKDRTDRPTNTLTFTVSHWLPHASGTVPSNSPDPLCPELSGQQPGPRCSSRTPTIIKVSSSAGVDQSANFRARGPGLHCFTAVQLWATV